MQIESVAGVQLIALVTHAVVGAIVFRNRQPDQKLPDLTFSAAFIGSTLYLISLVECSSGLYSTLSMFPMLIPMIVIPLVGSDLGLATGMGKWLHLFFVSALALSIYSVQLMFMIPQQYLVLALAAVACLAIATAAYANRYHKTHPNDSLPALLVSLVILTLPLMVQIFLPFLLTRNVLAVLLLAPIMSSMSLCTAAFAVIRLSKTASSERPSVLHSISHVVGKKRSISIKVQERRAIVPPAESSLASSDQQSSISDKQDRSLYNEGLTSDAGHDLGQDLIASSCDAYDDPQTENKTIGRLIPTDLVFCSTP